MTLIGRIRVGVIMNVLHQWIKLYKLPGYQVLMMEPSPEVVYTFFFIMVKRTNNSLIVLTGPLPSHQIVRGRGEGEEGGG